MPEPAFFVFSGLENLNRIKALNTANSSGVKIQLIRIIITICFAAAAIQPVIAQKVAVVLSGGGSRGTAHIGVLKALEENNIPVDYIAGTSIGALVGGLYAAGYSPLQIEQFFKSDEFDKWASGVIDPRYKYFYKNGDPDAGWISLELDFSKRFTKILPTNLISPVEMDFVLMRIFAGAAASADYNFDSLLIPFRCVTADIDSNKALVMSGGNLDKAIRASLTFPFYYKPIQIDGRLLFDGGMYNNFPVDVVQKDFNPDLIIGSKVAGNYPKPEADDLLSQIQNMLTVNTDFTIDTARGILIEPPVRKVNLVDFSPAAEFIDSGYVEAMRHIPEIKRRVGRRVPGHVLDSARMAFNSRKPPYIIDSIHISGLSDREKSYVYRTLLHNKDRATLSDITPEYFKLAADDKLILEGSSLRYNTLTGLYDLYLHLKPADRFTLKFGGNISSRLANQAFVELNYKYLFRDALNLKANVYFGRFYTSALFGLRLDVPSRFPYYLGSRLVYNHFDYFKSTIHFFEDLTPSFLIQDDNYLSVYGGIPVTNKGRLQAEYKLGILENDYYQNNLFSREDTADNTQFRFMSGTLNWELNSLNRKQYADAGARFMISAAYVNGLEDFTSGSLSNQSTDSMNTSHQWLNFRLLWDNYFERIGPVQLGFYTELNLSTQEFFSNYTSSLLAAPAFNPVPESKTVFLPRYRAYNYGAVGFKAVLGLSRRFDFRAETYLFQPYREILENENNDAYFGDPFAGRHLMAAGTLVYHSFIGPLSLSVNYFDNPEEKIYVALNIGYIIFNKRALEY